MQISFVTVPLPVAPRRAAEPAVGVAAPAVLSEPTETGNLRAQVAAYQDVSSRWRTASDAERAALTPALTDSAFARRAQDALNSFTRAAWAGAGATPPAPEAKMLQAFDGLSETDQEIVAGLHMDRNGKSVFGSASAFREQLVADLEAVDPQASAPAPRPADKITLSEEAKARLADGAAEAWSTLPAPTAADPEVARAIAAYSSV